MLDRLLQAGLWWIVPAAVVVGAIGGALGAAGRCIAEWARGRQP